MSTKVVTGKIRASYANIMRPRKNELNGKEEYSVVVLVPKTDTDTLDALKAAAKAAIAAKWPQPPRGLRNPLRDGDAETKSDGSPLGAEYKGHFFFNSKSDAMRKPGVIDAACRDLIDADAIVSGDFIRVSVNAYAYDQAGNRGVSFGLNNVQLLEKGPSLGSGKATAAQDFGPAPGAAKAPVTDDVSDDEWA